MALTDAKIRVAEPDTNLSFEAIARQWHASNKNQECIMVIIFNDANELIDKIDEYVEYYNTKRIKAKLKDLTPVEYRNQVLETA